MVRWVKTKDTGVRYWVSDTRKYKGKPEKCFVIRYKRHGQTVSETIGWQSEGDIDSDYCSRIRGQIIANIKAGVGSHSFKEKETLEAAKRKAKKVKAVTLSQAFDEFLNAKARKQTTIREYKRSMRTAFSDWEHRRIIDITRDMVSARHKKLKQETEKNFLKKCKDQKRKPTAKEREKAGAAQGNLHMRFLRAFVR